MAQETSEIADSTNSELNRQIGMLFLTPPPSPPSPHLLTENFRSIANPTERPGRGPRYAE
jgi:hypothetical protein